METARSKGGPGTALSLNLNQVISLRSNKPSTLDGERDTLWLLLKIAIRQQFPHSKGAQSTRSPRYHPGSPRLARPSPALRDRKAALTPCPMGGEAGAHFRPLGKDFFELLMTSRTKECSLLAEDKRLLVIVEHHQRD